MPRVSMCASTFAKTRAACLIGLGRHEDARAILESQKKNQEPVWNLLRRVSSAAAQGQETSDEAALIALLDVLPSL